MKRKTVSVGILIISVFISLLSQSALPPDSKGTPPERHSATSSLEFRVVAGKEHTITQNQRFSVIYRCLDKCSDIVLHESFYSDQEEGVEGTRGTVSVTAWRKDAPTVVMWKLKAAGDEGKPTDAFYEITQFGCCGGWDDKTYFALRTGQNVYNSAENGLLKIEVPNTQTKRYVAYTYPASRKAIGLLQFGDAEKLLQKVTIGEPQVEQPPTIALRLSGQPDSQSVTLWSHKGDKSAKAVSGVSVVLTYDSREVVVPIENDRFAVQSAKAPKGYTFTE